MSASDRKLGRAAQQAAQVFYELGAKPPPILPPNLAPNQRAFQSDIAVRSCPGVCSHYGVSLPGLFNAGFKFVQPPRCLFLEADAVISPGTDP